LDKSLMLVVIGGYFALVLYIGFKVSHLIKTSEDYFIAGRNLGFLSFIMLIIGSIISGMTVLGSSGLSYVAGWPSMWEPIFVTLSIAVLITLFGAKLYRVSRKFGYYTVQDYLSHRFESPKVIRGIAGIAGILISFIYLTGQFTAISIVLSWLLGIDHVYALLIGTVVVTLYVFLGGLYAVAYTTLVQALALLFGTIFITPFVIKAAGGLTAINTQLAAVNPQFIAAAYPQVHPPAAGNAFLTPYFIISFFFLLTFGLSTAPHALNNILSARKAIYFKWAPLFAFVFYIVVFYLIKIAGFAARALVAQGAITVPHPDYALISAIQYVLPPFVWALFGVVVLAAVMSTTDRLLLTIGTLYSWDIHRKLINPGIDDQKLQKLSRLVVVGASILAFLAAINPPELLAWLIWMAIGLMLSTYCTPLLAGLYWKRANRQGAIASMAAGLSVSLITGYLHRFVAPLPVHFSFYGFGASILALVVVSLLTPPAPDKLIQETEAGFYFQHKTS
jgi:SSS family transporter